MTKKAIFAVILMFLMIGCQPADEAQQQDSEPEVEIPSAEPSVTVEEDVISPAFEPEPEEEEPEVQEPEPEPEPTSLLDDFQSSERLISSNPAVGGSITRSPRKVMLVFDYPITEGTDIKVFDMTGTKRYDSDNTIIDYDDSVVAFVYVVITEPGIYMVIYNAVFPNREGNIEQEGYYYFELQ